MDIALSVLPRTAMQTSLGMTSNAAVIAVELPRIASKRLLQLHLRNRFRKRWNHQRQSWRSLKQSWKSPRKSWKRPRQSLECEAFRQEQACLAYMYALIEAFQERLHALFSPYCCCDVCMHSACKPYTLIACPCRLLKFLK